MFVTLYTTPRNYTMRLTVTNDDLFGFPTFVEYAKFFRECFKKL